MVSLSGSAVAWSSQCSALESNKVLNIGSSGVSVPFLKWLLTLLWLLKMLTRL